MINELQRELEFLGLCIEQELDNNGNNLIKVYDEDHGDLVLVIDKDFNVYDIESRVIGERLDVQEIKNYLKGTY